MKKIHVRFHNQQVVELGSKPSFLQSFFLTITQSLL